MGHGRSRTLGDRDCRSGPSHPCRDRGARRDGDPRPCRRRRLDDPRQGDDPDQRPRLRARPRHVAARRPGRGSSGADPPGDRRVLLPGYDARHRQGQGQRAGERRHQQGRQGSGRARAEAARARQRQGARPGQGQAAGVALEGHTGRRGPGGGVLPHRGLEAVPHRHRGRRALPHRCRDDAGAAVRRQGRLSRRAALGEEGHRQRAAARQVPPGRRAPGGPGALGARGGAGAGGRGAHLRGVRAGAPDRVALPDLRHHLLPGLRRRHCRAPGRHRRDQGVQGRGRAVRRRAGLHAVLGVQRWLDLGRLRAVPGGEAGPLRRLVGEPALRVADGGQRRHRREGVARRSAT